jgi:hypothetical protein
MKGSVKSRKLKFYNKKKRTGCVVTKLASLFLDMNF